MFIYEVLKATKIHQENYRIDNIEQAIQYIEKNYHNADLRLEHVSEHVGLSTAYMSSLLTKRRGESFRRILTNIRIEAAKKLLMETKQSVQEISNQVGFANSNYFSQIFIGVVPVTTRILSNNIQNEHSRFIETCDVLSYMGCREKSIA